MGKPRQSNQVKTKYVSLRLEPDLYARFNAAIIREQARENTRIYASTVLTKAIQKYVERSEQAQ